jgi:membrane protein YdbS with pleckstrin-like domain
MIKQFGRLMDRLLCLAPEPPHTANGQIFRPTYRTLLYELVVWALGQSVALLLLILILFGAPIIEALAWTGWAWLLELALQWTAWFDRLLLDIVPTAFQGFIAVFGILAFIAQFLLTLAGIWARQRYTWLVAGDVGIRLRRGWFQSHDVTMRYSAIQQVHLRQGPLQRLIGVGTVEISSAANRHDDEDEGKRPTRVQNIPHPTSLRNLVRSRVEATQQRALPAPTDATSAAAAEFLDAARTLRTLLVDRAAVRTEGTQRVVHSDTPPRDR